MVKYDPAMTLAENVYGMLVPDKPGTAPPLTSMMATCQEVLPDLQLKVHCFPGNLHTNFPRKRIYITVTRRSRAGADGNGVGSPTWHASVEAMVRVLC